jgi:hypothetical protein
MTERIQQILEPETAHFSSSPDGSLQLDIKGIKFFPRIWIYRSYPLSHKGEFLSVRDATDEDLPEIGVIPDLAQFPEAAQEIILSELQRRYYVPVITNVLSIKEARDHLHWNVVTDKGPREFIVRNPFDRIRTLENNRLLIIDDHNCRYEMENYQMLPEKLKYMLSKYIYL